jgi:hypothetical protein
MAAKKHDEVSREAPPPPAPAPASAEPQPFPFTGSINEPQTVSLPLPQGTKVPVPAITGYDPYECTLGDPDFTLFITGDNFFKDSVINFAGQDEPTTLNEDGRLSTGINMSVWHGPDTVQVVVKNGPEVSAPVEFTFNEAATRKGKR